MIDSPLDGGEVVRFGNTLHGLMNATTQRVEISGVERPLPAVYQAWRDFSGSAGIQGADFGDTHLVRVPGVAPLGMSPEELAAELAAGRAWQNYALLSGPHQMVFGHPLSGWIYIDEAGGRWLVRQSGGPSIINYGQVGVAQSLGITLSITPFGDIGAEPVSPIHVQASLADIGQANPPGVTAERGDVLHLRVTSISSHGRRAIIALYPLRIAGTQMIDYDPRDLPYGWLSLELSGSGQAIAATLAVLRTRTQALGQRIRSTPVSQPLKAALTLTGGCSISGDRVVGSWSASAELVPHGAGLPSLIGTDTGYFYNHQLENRDELDHRIVCLVFDDADDVREISVTATAVTLEAASTEPSAGGSYAIDSVLINGVPVSGRPVTGSVSLSITRGIQRDTEVSMAIMVDGVIVDAYLVESTESAVESYSVELGSEFSGGAAQMYGHYFGGSVFYDINSGTATDMRGVNAYTDAIPPSRHPAIAVREGDGRFARPVGHRRPRRPGQHADRRHQRAVLARRAHAQPGRAGDRDHHAAAVQSAAHAAHRAIRWRGIDAVQRRIVCSDHPARGRVGRAAGRHQPAPGAWQLRADQAAGLRGAFQRPRPARLAPLDIGSMHAAIHQQLVGLAAAAAGS